MSNGRCPSLFHVKFGDVRGDCSFCWYWCNVGHHCLEVIVGFFDIFGIVDHHCLEEIVRFVNIGRIVEHYCWEEIVRFVNIGIIVNHHCWEEIVCFVNIGRIVDNRWLEVIVKFVNIGRVCWQSLFKLSFHKRYNHLSCTCININVILM